MAKPLMARATAVWLVDNTTITFKQIADFVGMHELEVQGIADGDVATVRDHLQRRGRIIVETQLARTLQIELAARLLAARAERRVQPEHALAVSRHGQLARCVMRRARPRAHVLLHLRGIATVSSVWRMCRPRLLGLLLRLYLQWQFCSLSLDGTRTEFTRT